MLLPPHSTRIGENISRSNEHSRLLMGTIQTTGRPLLLSLSNGMEPQPNTRKASRNIGQSMPSISR